VLRTGVTQTKRAAETGALFEVQPLEKSDRQAGVAVLELRQPAAAVEQVLLAASPGRMRARVDVEVQRVAGRAVGRARLVAGAVGHYHRDRVVVGMDLVFHRSRPLASARFGHPACVDASLLKNVKPQLLGSRGF